jgi:hypothetical protein
MNEENETFRKKINGLVDVIKIKDGMLLCFMYREKNIVLFQFLKQYEELEKEKRKFYQEYRFLECQK